MSVFGVILVRIFPHSHFVSARIQSECGKLQTGITLNTVTFRAVILSGLPNTTTTLLNATDIALKFSDRCVLVCRLNIGMYGPRPVYFRLQSLCKYKLTEEKVWRKQAGSEWVEKYFSNKYCVKVVRIRNFFICIFPQLDWIQRF